MGILNKIKSLFNKNDYKGFIGHFDLDQWWESEFSEEERKYIIDKKPEIIKGKYNNINKKPTQFLQETTQWFSNKEDTNISLKLLDKAEELVEDKIDLHYLYNSKIKTLYKKRNENKEYIELCIKYCKKDIELYINKLRHEYPFNEKNTRVPAFQRLAIIYEKRKEYQKAIEVCKKAIKYNMREKNKDNFKDRLNRLKSKVN